MFKIKSLNFKGNQKRKFYVLHLLVSLVFVVLVVLVCPAVGTALLHSSSLKVLLLLRLTFLAPGGHAAAGGALLTSTRIARRSIRHAEFTLHTTKENLN